MFNQNAPTGWFPYTIPPTPLKSGTEDYALSFKGSGNPEKNPSEFLEWKKMEQSDLSEILNRLSAIEQRLDSATIEASCDGGNIVVTLNL